MSLRIKKGDTVQLMVGSKEYKGLTGKVLSVDPENELVKVEGLKMVSRHRKSRTAQDQSKIVKMEGNIAISNVMLVCPTCNKPRRIKTVEVDGKRHRQCYKCGFDFDVKKKEESKKTAKTEKSNSRVKRTRKSDKAETNKD